jgi:hypothetical protein
MNIRYYYFLMMLLIGTCLTSCKNWDERLVSGNDNLGLTLFDKISGQTELSTFKSLLVKTGYDKVLASSKNYTVWAPTNDALASLNTAILNDTTALKAFVGNHIAYQTNEVLSTSTQRNLVPMLNGKYSTVLGSTFNGIKLVSANTFVGNGVLHTIGASSTVLPSLWDFIKANQAQYKQNNAIVSLTRLVFNASKADTAGIDPLTGKQLYKPNTGFEEVNRFTQGVADVKLESKRYTYFLLKDAAFNTETAKISSYYKAGGDTTNVEAAFNTVKDLLVEGEYTLETLPTTLTSKFGVKFTIDKAAIEGSIPLSNGTAYILNNINVTIADKYQPIVIEGENWVGRSSTPATLTAAMAVVRDLEDPATGRTFKQMSVVGHGVTGFFLRYSIASLPALKYKVYWVAVNDLYNSNTATGETATYAMSQRLVMGTSTSTTFPLTTLTAKNYSEVLLGEYTPAQFGTLNMYLTANGTGAIALDYIKLVPSL